MENAFDFGRHRWLYRGLAFFAFALASALFLDPSHAQGNLHLQGTLTPGQCVNAVDLTTVQGVACPGAAPTGANPTATATGSPINGVATTFMRSDAAPAISATTINGTPCTPGSSCTVAAATLGTPTTTYLTSNQALTVGNFIDGPTTGSIGGAGQIWLISGQVTMNDNSGVGNLEGAIFNGSAYIADSVITSQGTNAQVVVPLTPVVVTLAGATTFTIRGKALTANGTMLTTGTATGTAQRATYITAIRLQ